MDPATSSLIAALVAVVAVLMACVAAGLVLLAVRGPARLAGTRRGLARTTGRVAQELPRVRRLLEDMEVDLVRLRQQDVEMDRRLSAATDTLVPVRRAIEGVTRGRLAVLIRGAGMLSRAAQFALLWR